LEIRNQSITLPNFDENSVWHLFVAKIKDRNLWVTKLADCGIQTVIHYPISPSKQQAFSGLNIPPCPFAEKLAEEVLSLPISPWMTESMVNYVIDKINILK